MAPYDQGLVLHREGQAGNIAGRAGRKEPVRRVDRLFGQLDIEPLLRLDHAIKPAEAIKLDDQNTGALLKVGLVYANQNRFQEAIDTWEKVLQIDPANKYAPAYIAKAKPRLASAPSPVETTSQPVQASVPLSTPVVTLETTPAPVATAPKVVTAEDEAAAKVPQELLEKMSLIGSEGHVRERLAAMKESGITTLNVSPIAGDHKGRIALIEKVKQMAADL